MRRVGAAGEERRAVGATTLLFPRFCCFVFWLVVVFSFAVLSAVQVVELGSWTGC